MINKYFDEPIVENDLFYLCFLIETLNDFYDGAINEADLTDIIKNIQSDDTTKA